MVDVRRSVGNFSVTVESPSNGAYAGEVSGKVNTIESGCFKTADSEFVISVVKKKLSLSQKQQWKFSSESKHVFLRSHIDLRKWRTGGEVVISGNDEISARMLVSKVNYVQFFECSEASMEFNKFAEFIGLVICFFPRFPPAG